MRLRNPRGSRDKVSLEGFVWATEKGGVNGGCEWARKGGSRVRQERNGSLYKARKWKALAPVWGKDGYPIWVVGDIGSTGQKREYCREINDRKDKNDMVQGVVDVLKKWEMSRELMEVWEIGGETAADAWKIGMRIWVRDWVTTERNKSGGTLSRDYVGGRGRTSAYFIIDRWSEV